MCSVLLYPIFKEYRCCLLITILHSPLLQVLEFDVQIINLVYIRSNNKVLKNKDCNLGAYVP